MILMIILLFIVGLLAIVAETFMPFGVSAIAGFLVLGYSCYLAIHEYGSALGLLYCIVALVSACLVVWYGIKSGLSWSVLTPPKSKRKPGRGDDANPARPPTGAIATVVQPLRPTGTIEWEGRRLPARSVDPTRETPLGASVRIEDRDSIYWLVEELTDEGK